jgi:hypothetical protein
MDKHLEPTISGLEPCASCGEDTAVGSIFFSDRLTIPRDGLPDAHLCVLCFARIRAKHKPQRWTDEEVAAFVRNASAADITWMSRY